VLFYHIVAANLQVVYIVLHPELPVRPGTVKVRTGLRTEAGRTALANSITLTPGTLSVDIDDEEGTLYVHWIVVGAEDDESATREIVGRFEPLLRRIFE
jgi:multicomponent Na+:H+ antiporter subunit E